MPEGLWQRTPMLDGRIRILGVVCRQPALDGDRERGFHLHHYLQYAHHTLYTQRTLISHQTINVSIGDIFTVQIMTNCLLE